MDSVPPPDRPHQATAPSAASAPTGEEMLDAAIARTLEAEPGERAELFERLSGEIEAITTAPGSEMRPWTRSVRTGVDGSRIFSGGVGLSIVVDPQGRLWRGRTYEDFTTTHRLTPTTCEIETMAPRYELMREYTLPASRGSAGSAGAPDRSVALSEPAAGA